MRTFVKCHHILKRKKKYINYVFEYIILDFENGCFRFRLNL